jgi:uncharacterized membrane protein YhaH (DUF805 family)
MNFGQAVTHVIGNSFNFSGRACRSEFWWWALLANIITVTAWIVDAQLQTGLLVMASALVLMFPNLAVEVRRLHDTDASGWWVLLSFIPIVGAIGLMIWFCQSGTYGSNQYGPDPLGNVGHLERQAMTEPVIDGPPN